MSKRCGFTRRRRRAARGDLTPPGPARRGASTATLSTTAMASGARTQEVAMARSTSPWSVERDASALILVPIGRGSHQVYGGSTASIGFGP